MKYYLVSLKYNKNSNKTKIRNVKKIDLDGLMIENEYESIPVIVYESYSMYSSYLVDVLSGKKIYSETEDVEGLKYTFKSEAGENEVIRIANLYRSLTSDDIDRYKTGIREIEVDSINEYKKAKLDEENKMISFKNANNYLTTLIIEK